MTEKFTHCLFTAEGSPFSPAAEGLPVLSRPDLLSYSRVALLQHGRPRAGTPRRDRRSSLRTAFPDSPSASGDSLSTLLTPPQLNPDM